MRAKNGRTWKAQDLQAQRPKAWCRYCGREFYQRAPAGGICKSCRRAGRRKGGTGP